MDAFANTALLHSKRVGRFALSLTRNEAHAGGLVPETFLRACHAGAWVKQREVRVAHRYRSLLLVPAVALACAGDPTTPPPPPPPQVADVRLKDVVIPNLPSPYYRFEYDSTGNVTFVSYASDLHTYDIHYKGDRISEIEAITLRFIRERLTYSYDEAGRVRLITFADSLGAVLAHIRLTYAGERLVMLERDRRVEGGFQFDKSMSFAYDADGNLAVLTDQRLPFPGQDEATYVDRFEQYDAGINVDGFSLIHNEFFEHLVLLPGVRLQLGNPGRVTRSGSGPHYTIDYTYTYDSENRPLMKHGEAVYLTGPDAGRRFQTNSTFLYE